MSYGDYGKMTELEAVNLCLSIIGEQPVSSIPSSGVSEATIARDKIYEMSRDVQTEGLLCNTEYDYSLIPDVDGYCNLPSNTLDVDPDDYYYDYVERDSKLYDRENNTAVFTDTVKVTIVFFLAWTKLPQHVRKYIAILAARDYQESFVADKDLWRFSQDDEDKAKRQMMRKEGRNSNFSLFDNTYLNRGVLRRK